MSDLNKVLELEKEWAAFRGFTSDSLITGIGYFKYQEEDSAFNTLKKWILSDGVHLPEISIRPGSTQFSANALIVWVEGKKLGWITQRYVKAFSRFMAKVSGQDADELNWSWLRTHSMRFFVTKKSVFSEVAYQSKIDIAPVFWIGGTACWLSDPWYQKLSPVPSLETTKTAEEKNFDHYLDTLNVPLILQTTNNFKQGNKMSQVVNKVINSNTEAMKVAAYNEAARIVLNKATKVVSAQAPLMVRGYVETPFGKLVVANLFQYLIQNYRGQDSRLLSLSQAMVANSYQEILQGFNLEKMLDELTSGINLPELVSAESGNGVGTE